MVKTRPNLLRRTFTAGFIPPVTKNDEIQRELKQTDKNRDAFGI